MTLQDFNQLAQQERKAHLTNCCGSQRWVGSIDEGIPYADAQTLLRKAQVAWFDECASEDWLEAFANHPRIGDKKNISDKVKDSIHLAAGEQSGVAESDAKLLLKLHAANIEYEAKFGFTFIVCATGKSGEEMLDILEGRINNTREEELHIAMGEQWKISLIRLKNLLSGLDFPQLKSKITTHILDTSLGKPAAGVAVHLFHFADNAWEKIASGITNEDGRIQDLHSPRFEKTSANYKLQFMTAAYFASLGHDAFYPEVQIIFNIKEDGHYHVPLLLNPFGYSTYRGS